MSLMFKLFFIAFFCNLSSSFKCKDENNEDVDWYVLYKLPAEEHVSGAAYFYMTANTYQNGWKLSNLSINSDKSIPGLTLRPYYQNETYMHVFYNDQPPDKSENSKLGHTKGLIISDETSGLWLIHSVPHYPPEVLYSYPDTGTMYGQSFLCISLSFEGLNLVGFQLQYNQPHMYVAFLSDLLRSKLGNVSNVINHEMINSAPWYNLQTLTSIGGQEFLVFAKGSKFGKELYEDWVAPFLKTDLLVETWLNGAGRIPSDCNNIFKVNNIEAINLANISFHSSLDHSKWTISNSSNLNWVCIGDINRQEHQKQRGGGTVCLNKKELGQNYKNIVAKIEPCK